MPSTGAAAAWVVVVPRCERRHGPDAVSTLADPHLLLLNCRSKPSGLCLRPATPRLPSHLRLHSWLSKPHRSCLLLSRRTCRAPSVGPQHHRQPLHSTPSSQSRERHAKRQLRLSWTLSSTGQSQSTSHWCLAQSHRLSRPPTAFRTDCDVLSSRSEHANLSMSLCASLADEALCRLSPIRADSGPAGNRLSVRCGSGVRGLSYARCPHV